MEGPGVSENDRMLLRVCTLPNSTDQQSHVLRRRTGSLKKNPSSTTSLVRGNTYPWTIHAATLTYTYHPQTTDNLPSYVPSPIPESTNLFDVHRRGCGVPRRTGGSVIRRIVRVFLVGESRVPLGDGSYDDHSQPRTPYELERQRLRMWVRTRSCESRGREPAWTPNTLLRPSSLTSPSVPP